MTPFSWTFRDWLRACAVFGMGTVCGMTVWWMSPLITGHEEPWQDEEYFYLGSLAIAGLVATLLLAKAFWVAPFGVLAGQLVYGIYLHDPSDPLFWPLVTVTLLVYSSAALFGAIVGAIFVWILSMLLGIVRFFTGIGKEKQSHASV